MVNTVLMSLMCIFFFFQAEDGIRDVERSRGLGDVYKRQDYPGINDTTQCRTKMDGLVAVYQLDTCALEVVGSICKVGGDGRVELHYPCSHP